MDREVILTEEGYRKLTEEIEHLSTVKRREVAQRIKEARDFGDISENSEYDDAKNEQAQLEYRIRTLEYAIVGSAEADPRNHRLSNESPVGKALLGKKKGDKVTIPAPKGALQY